MNKSKTNSRNLTTRIDNDSKPSIPTWMDCAWRRLPCEKEDCPLCSQIAKDRERHLAKGEDPDEISVALEDVGNYFKKTLKAIRKSAKENGLNLLNMKKLKEPPEPQDFPMYHKVNNWRNGIHDIADDSDDVSSTWLFSDAGEDLLWYSNALAAKTYRQLTNRWHLQSGSDYGDFDYEYTQYVITECVQLLKKALGELIDMEIAQRGKFSIALMSLAGFENDIKKI
jgi:hypothetical protein